MKSRAGEGAASFPGLATRGRAAPFLSAWPGVSKGWVQALGLPVAVSSWRPRSAGVSLLLVSRPFLSQQFQVPGSQWAYPLSSQPLGPASPPAGPLSGLLGAAVFLLGTSLVLRLCPGCPWGHSFAAKGRPVSQAQFPGARQGWADRHRALWWAACCGGTLGGRQPCPTSCP